MSYIALIIFAIIGMAIYGHVSMKPWAIKRSVQHGIIDHWVNCGTTICGEELLYLTVSLYTIHVSAKAGDINSATITHIFWPRRVHVNQSSSRNRQHAAILIWLTRRYRQYLAEQKRVIWLRQDLSDLRAEAESMSS